MAAFSAAWVVSECYSALTGQLEERRRRDGQAQQRRERLAQLAEAVRSDVALLVPAGDGAALAEVVQRLYERCTADSEDAQHALRAYEAQGGVAALGRCLRARAKATPELALAACLLLRECLRAATAAAADAGPMLEDAVLLLKMHPTHRQVACAVARALADYTSPRGSAAARSRCRHAVAAEAVPVLTAMLGDYGKSPEACGAWALAGEALANIASGDAPGCAAAVLTGALPLVLQALQQHPTSAPVCEQGCSLLAALASELSQQQRVVVAQNARGLVLAALQHPSARTQAGAAMTALGIAL